MALQKGRYCGDHRDNEDWVTLFLPHGYPLALVQVHSDLVSSRKPEHGAIVISYDSGWARDRRQVNVGTRRTGSRYGHRRADVIIMAEEDLAMVRNEDWRRCRGSW
jgi:hypothetical protein